MKRFIKNILILVIPILLLMYPLDVFLSKELKKCDKEYLGEVTIWEDIYNSRMNYDLLIYGTSRAWLHIDPAIIEGGTGLSAYNLGMDGQDFGTIEFRHQQVLKYNKAPKVILFSLDDTTLSKRLGIYLKEQFLPYMLWNNDMEDVFSQYEGYDKYDCEIPLLRYAGDYKTIRLAIKTALKKKSDEPPYRRKGYRPLPKTWTKEFDNLLATLTPDDTSQNIIVNRGLEGMFIKFIAECKQNNIQLVLVYTPTYYKMDMIRKNMQDVLDLYKKIAEENNVPFLDYSKDPMCSDIKYFYNAAHLNTFGSQIFSKKLAGDLSKENILYLHKN